MEKSKTNSDEQFRQRAAQQINGREGETATFLTRCVVIFGLCVAGFAPRQLNRYVFGVC